MVGMRRKTYERNDLETIIYSDGILRLNWKHIEEELDHKNLRVVTVKYLSELRKQRHELVDQPKNNATELLYKKN